MESPLWHNFFRKETAESRIVDAISKNKIFEKLSARELNLVEKLIHSRTYKPGETVFQQGEVGVGMYIVVKGAVDIFVESVNIRENTSHPVFVARLQEGDFFGELALVEPTGRRTASAIAGEESFLLGFFRPDLLSLMERSPSTATRIIFSLAEVLGRRLKETTDKVSKLKRELQG